MITMTPGTDGVAQDSSRAAAHTMTTMTITMIAARATTMTTTTISHAGADGAVARATMTTISSLVAIGNCFAMCSTSDLRSPYGRGAGGEVQKCRGCLLW